MIDSELDCGISQNNLSDNSNYESNIDSLPPSDGRDSFQENGRKCRQEEAEDCPAEIVIVNTTLFF